MEVTFDAYSGRVNEFWYTTLTDEKAILEMILAAGLPTEQPPPIPSLGYRGVVASGFRLYKGFIFSNSGCSADPDRKIERRLIETNGDHKFLDMAGF